MTTSDPLESTENGASGATIGPMREIPARPMERSYGGRNLANQPSMGQLMRFLQSHDNDGIAKVAFVQLAYQTGEHAADDRPASQLDLWTVDPELTGDGLRARLREIADLAWNGATAFMATAKVPHVFKLHRRNAEDRAAGVYLFKLDPTIDNLGTDGVGMDSPNERGGYAANLRVFNQGHALAYQTIKDFSRMQLEMMSDVREENRHLREESRASIAREQDLLDRQQTRTVEANNAAFDLDVKKKIAGGLEKGVDAFIQKQLPPQAHVAELIKHLDMEKLLAITPQILSTLEPEGQRAFLGMIQSFGAQEQMMKATAARAAAKAAEAQEKAEKEAKEEAERAAKTAKKGGTK